MRPILTVAAVAAFVGLGSVLLGVNLAMGCGEINAPGPTYCLGPIEAVQIAWIAAWN